MIDLAIGVKVEGKKGVYSSPPDARAGIYLLDRIMGKPIQRSELTGADGGPITAHMSPINLKALDQSDLDQLEKIVQKANEPTDAD